MSLQSLCKVNSIVIINVNWIVCFDYRHYFDVSLFTYIYSPAQ